jgi:CBS domain-containing protein
MHISDVLRVKGSQVVTVQQTNTVGSVVRILAEKSVGAVVVEDKWAKLVGIFSERDLVRALAARGADALSLEVRDLMTTSVITCTPTDPIDVVLARMTMHRIRHLPVMEDTRLAGIVSIGDLVHTRLSEKELEAGVLLDITRMRG